MTPVPGSFVVDASVAVKLFLPEALSREAEHWFGRQAERPGVSLFAPDLIFTEGANVFWKAVKKKVWTAEQAQSNLLLLLGLGFEATPTVGLVPMALQWATECGISVYDACYVALAAQLTVPLITADRRLALKIPESTVEIRVLGDERDR